MRSCVFGLFWLLLAICSALSNVRKAQFSHLGSIGARKCPKS